MKEQLKRFDELWAEYEQKYVYELMVIESDARRFIIDSINAEVILSQDHMQLLTMQSTKKEKRQEILSNICQINAVANVEGKGRSDFEISLLERSEQLEQDKREKLYSQAVSKLAAGVQSSFEAYRKLIRHYQTNIELVDP